MKTRENKAMRFASVLLVLTLLATSLTAGTFAKYVTSAEDSATARVAKFGVDVSVNATNVFGERYKSNDGTVTELEDGISVKADSSDDKNVVAPGTNGKMIFSITGNPETSVDLSIEMNVTEEVMLDAGTYTNNVDETVTLDAVYNPVKWTLMKEGNDKALLENTTLSEIEKYLEASSFSKEYGPNKLSEIAGNYTLSWTWDIENATDKDKFNVADTILGDLAAVGEDIANAGITKNGTTITKDSFKLNENFTLTISVKQVD